MVFKQDIHKVKDIVISTLVKLNFKIVNVFMSKFIVFGELQRSLGC